MLIQAVDRSVRDTDNEAMYRQAGARVIRWRREHDAMSQVQFASRAGISVGCLQSFEKGKRHTREQHIARIAAVMGLTLDQLKADDADAGQIPNPLLDDLLQEDLRLAQHFHHAGAETKHAVKKFLAAPMSEEKRERIALMLAALVRLDEAQFPIVESIVTPLDKDGRSPAANAPTLGVVAPPHKKKG